MENNLRDSREWEQFEKFMKRKEGKKADREMRSDEIKRKWGPIQTSLASELSTSITGYNWSTEERLLYGRQQKVDILGVSKSRDCRVGIELERDRATCVRNVIKVWMAMRQIQGAFFLIHIFSPVFANEKLIWREEAEFVGKKASTATKWKANLQAHPA